MKYSIRGNLVNAIEDDLYLITDNYPIRQLVTSKYVIEDGSVMFNFEVWVATVKVKNNLYDELKDLIDSHNGFMAWHECYHDELPTRPCEEPKDHYGTLYEVI